MSISVLPNVNWNISAGFSSYVTRAVTALSYPYRLVENRRLVAFKIKSKEDIDTPASISVEGCPELPLKIFLSKYLVLIWLQIADNDVPVSRYITSRLVAYLTYYQGILEELRAGNHEILNRWWDIECTSQFCQHSSGRVDRIEGRFPEQRVRLENEIEWGLKDIWNASNLAMVSDDMLTEAAGDVYDWLKAELQREVGDDFELEEFDEGISDGECNKRITECRRY